MVRAKTDVSKLNGASSLDENDKFIVNQVDSGKPVTKTSSLGDLKTFIGPFSGDYNDLDNKPTIGDGEITIRDSDGSEFGSFTVNQTGDTTITIPSIGDGTITIQDSGGTEVGSFTVNQTGDTTITIPQGSNVTVSPNPPTGSNQGDLWFDNNTGILYVYYKDIDSEQWVSIGGGGTGSNVTVSPNPPTGSNQGDLWFDNNTGILYVYYKDIDSEQWVSIGGNISNGANISNMPPTDASPGDFWLDNETGILYVYYISQWISV